MSHESIANHSIETLKSNYSMYTILNDVRGLSKSDRDDFINNSTEAQFALVRFDCMKDLLEAGVLSLKTVLAFNSNQAEMLYKSFKVPSYYEEEMKPYTHPPLECLLTDAFDGLSGLNKNVPTHLEVNFDGKTLNEIEAFLSCATMEQRNLARSGPLKDLLKAQVLSLETVLTFTSKQVKMLSESLAKSPTHVLRCLATELFADVKDLKTDTPTPLKAGFGGESLNNIAAFIAETSESDASSIIQELLHREAGSALVGATDLTLNHLAKMSHEEATALMESIGKSDDVFVNVAKSIFPTVLTQAVAYLSDLLKAFIEKWMPDKNNGCCIDCESNCEMDWEFGCESERESSNDFESSGPMASHPRQALFSNPGKKSGSLDDEDCQHASKTEYTKST